MSFSPVVSNTGHFTITPFPATLFETPPPFGAGALLVLNKYDNDSFSMRSEHALGISIAAAQAANSVRALEIYGITDRAGSESHNLTLSRRRAETARTALMTALGLGPNSITFANGLGERFAAEFFDLKGENDRDPTMRGVACYLWDSFAVATDPFLQVSVAFATPPTGGGRFRSFLAALHMGRLRAQPRSIFSSSGGGASL